MIYFNYLIDKLKESDKKYKELFQDRIFYIRTEDNMFIKFSIRKGNLPHLLGINSGYYKNTSSIQGGMYDFFQKLINDSSFYGNKIKRGETNFNQIFSKSVQYKVESFNSLLSIDENSIPLVFASKQYGTNNELFSSDCDYFLYFTNGIGEYPSYFIGLKYDEENKYYFPKTLISCNSEEYFKNIVSGHRLFKVKNFDIKNTATNETVSYEVPLEEKFKTQKYIDKITKGKEERYIKVSTKNLRTKRINKTIKSEELDKLKKEVAFLNKALREVLADNQEYEKAYMELHNQFESYKIHEEKSSYVKSLKY